MIAGVYMSHSESFKYQIINKYLCGKLLRKEAAELLNVSIRTISRYSTKIKAKGIIGVKHGNCGKKPNQKYPTEVKLEIIELYNKKYFDYNLTHFSEVLLNTYKIKINYYTLWKWFRSEKLIKHPHRKRRKKHVFRPRMPQEGLILQMDGCHHRFNGKDEWCLVSAIDDATSEIPYAEFFKGETTLACMKVLKRIIEIKGVPKAIYTDRAGWSGGMKRTEFSNFKIACEKLGIQVIFANSPEAKGRIERSFRTIQDRLVPELRQAGATTMSEANKYLVDEFLAKYWNQQKIVAPRDTISAYEPLDPWLKLEEIFCIVEERKIASDQTVSYQGQRYVISGIAGSLAGYMASFKTNIKGELNVYVMEQKVKIEPTTTRLFNKEETVSFKIDDRNLYNGMYRLASNLNGAVWKSKVTGKPIKLPKTKRKKAS